MLWGFVLLFAILRQVLAGQHGLPRNPRSPCLSSKHLDSQVLLLLLFSVRKLAGLS